MNIQQLRYVVETAETGSMTLAARSLFVAQPALSRGIRMLEKELGLVLFSRQGRGVVLTPEGEKFVARARRTLESIETLGDVGDGSGPDGAVAIAASPTLQSVIAIPTLATLHQQGATVRARLVGCSSTPEVLDRVSSGRADIGICDDPTPSELAHLPLGRAEVRLYSPATVPLPDRVSGSDLASVPLVVPTPGTDRRIALDGFFAHFGVTPTIAVESDERNAWLDAVRHGLASCIWHSVEDFGGPLDGVVARGFDPPIHQEFAAVYRHEHRSEAVDRLLDVLEQLADLTPA